MVWWGVGWWGGVWCGMVWWDGGMTTNSGNLFLHFQTVGSFSCSYVSCNKFFHFLKPLKAPSTNFCPLSNLTCNLKMGCSITH